MCIPRERQKLRFSLLINAERETDVKVFLFIPRERQTLRFSLLIHTERETDLRFSLLIVQTERETDVKVFPSSCAYRERDRGYDFPFFLCIPRETEVRLPLLTVYTAGDSLLKFSCLLCITSETDITVFLLTLDFLNVPSERDRFNFILDMHRETCQETHMHSAYFEMKKLGLPTNHIKVDGNEKRGGSGRTQ